jgi:hypothetical protein
LPAALRRRRVLATKWPAVAALASVGLVFAHAIFMASATREGKFGEHLLPIVGA